MTLPPNPPKCKEIHLRMPSGLPRMAKHKTELFAVTMSLLYLPPTLGLSQLHVTLCWTTKINPTQTPSFQHVFLWSKILLTKEATLKLTIAGPQKCPWLQASWMPWGVYPGSCPVELDTHKQLECQSPAFKSQLWDFLAVNLDNLLSLSGPHVPHL